MNRSKQSLRRSAEPPLWSIAAAGAVIVLTPMLLYSLAPDGPIREGDTVFSTGSHKVPLFQPDRYREVGYESTCLLDPKDPLIVTHAPAEGRDDVIIAQVQGKPASSGHSVPLKRNSSSNDITSPNNPASCKT